MNWQQLRKYLSGNYPTEELPNDFDLLSLEWEVKLAYVAHQLKMPVEELLYLAQETFVHEFIIKERQWYSLTEREKQVARFVCKGLTNDEIALQLKISQNTVRTHLRRLLPKFGLTSKDELRQYLWHWRF
jgi:DNA-binding CsgD family transcriptional regulator